MFCNLNIPAQENSIEASLTIYDLHQINVVLTQDFIYLNSPQIATTILAANDKKLIRGSKRVDLHRSQTVFFTIMELYIGDFPRLRILLHNYINEGEVIVLEIRRSNDSELGEVLCRHYGCEEAPNVLKLIEASS